MKFIAYFLWTVSAPFFAGGIVWIFADKALHLPAWAIAVGFFAHTAVWGMVQEAITEAGWDRW